MTEESKTLKSQNWKYIIPYVGLHLLAFYVLTSGAEIGWTLQGKNFWQLAETAIKSTGWTAGLGFLAIILNGQFGDHLKAVIVFLRPQHPLPGCRAFSHYQYRDPRVNPQILQSRYGNFPTDPENQNRLWYRIYKKHEDQPSVEDAHGNYLLTRDLTALSAIFFVVLGSMSILLIQEPNRRAYYIIALAVLYVITSNATRKYGCRFVTNVLAIETGT